MDLLAGPRHHIIGDAIIDLLVLYLGRPPPVRGFYAVVQYIAGRGSWDVVLRRHGENPYQVRWTGPKGAATLVCQLRSGSNMRTWRTSAALRSPRNGRGGRR